MPSLRRSASTPSVVRSSPYPSRSALRNGTGSAARSGGRPKRSGGSETSSRRVLADIEWWKVQAAQIPEQLENEDDEQAELDLAAIARLPLVLAHVERPTTPDNQGSPEPMSPSGDMVAGPFSTLSIGPHTPERRRGHELESSWSSIESAPDATEDAAEFARFITSPTSRVDALMDDLPSLPNLHRGRPIVRSVTRSYSLPEIMSSRDPWTDFTFSPLPSVHN